MSSATPTEEKSFLQRSRSYLLTGLIVLGPIVVTLWLLLKSFTFLDGILASAINVLLRDMLGLTINGGEPIPGLGLAALIVLLLVTGFAAQNVLGKWMIIGGRRLINQIPLVSSVYSTLEQISHALFSSNHGAFKQAVIIVFPGPGMYSIGIITADSAGQVQAILPEECVTVFVPHTPSPATGFLIYVPRKNLIVLDISVEDALKLVISAGVIGGDKPTPESVK